MGNPYPIEIQAGDAGGPVVVVGEATFTDPSNQPGGGSVPGAPIVRGPFPFAFNTAGLLTGVAFYTPTINDLLLDAWIELTTCWDQTAKADIGTFVGLTTGLWGTNFSEATVLSNPPLSGPDNESSGAGLLTGEQSFTYSIFGLSNPGAGYGRVTPARFIAANPLKIVVSADGTQGGASPGAAAGAAKLYIVTSTPVAFS